MPRKKKEVPAETPVETAAAPEVEAPEVEATPTPVEAPGNAVPAGRNLTGLDPTTGLPMAGKPNPLAKPRAKREIVSGGFEYTVEEY